jgi:hydrogenase maturation protease
VNDWEWHLLEDNIPADSVCIGGHEVKRGDRVVLRPRAGGDILDLALAGQSATIESIEQDYEGKLHVAVVLDNDPGHDLGLLRQPGHRFFFTPEEIEPCLISGERDRRSTHRPAILVAGIGNIFLGDDGFGVEVARRLESENLPESVCVRDFGIRGYDLTYALLEGHELAILVDACPRGGTPGTLYVIEPDLNEADESLESVSMDGHTMNPVNVLRLAKAMGPISKRTVLVACEPGTLGGEEGYMGLSEPVSHAIDEAVTIIKELVGKAVERGAEVSPERNES